MRNEKVVCMRINASSECLVIWRRVSCMGSGTNTHAWGDGVYYDYVIVKALSHTHMAAVAVVFIWAFACVQCKHAVFFFISVSCKHCVIHEAGSFTIPWLISMRQSWVRCRYEGKEEDGKRWMVWEKHSNGMQSKEKEVTSGRSNFSRSSKFGTRDKRSFRKCWYARLKISHVVTIDQNRHASIRLKLTNSKRVYCSESNVCRTKC